MWVNFSDTVENFPNLDSMGILRIGLVKLAEIRWEKYEVNW